MKIWIHGDDYDRDFVTVYYTEPVWKGYWRANDRASLCRSAVEKVLRVRVPSWPELLEIDIKAKILCSWLPEGESWK